MPCYTKKPIVIQAAKFDNKDFIHWEPWLQNAYNKKQWGYRFDPVTGSPNGFTVSTLEGVMSAGPGDYLIRGVKGELYPCRGDIFEETYVRVEREEDGPWEN